MILFRHHWWFEYNCKDVDVHNNYRHLLKISRVAVDADTKEYLFAVIQYTPKFTISKTNGNLFEKLRELDDLVY